jgi:hypothetical protein
MKNLPSQPCWRKAATRLHQSGPSGSADYAGHALFFMIHLKKLPVLRSLPSRKGLDKRRMEGEPNSYGKHGL